METTIRPARADDACFLAWVILVSGRAHVKKGIWDVILGLPQPDCLDFLEKVVVTRIPHLFHYSCYLVAEVDGRPVAALGGYAPPDMGYERLRAALPEVYGKLGMGRPGLDADPGGDGNPVGVLQCLPEPVAGAWVVNSAATVPEFRRCGLINRLLVEIIAKGRRKGFSLAQITMYIGNNAALEAVRKQGFAIVAERRDALFAAEIGAPGMISLVHDI